MRSDLGLVGSRAGVAEQVSHGGSVAEPCDRAGCATLISDTSSGRLQSPWSQDHAAVAETTDSATRVQPDERRLHRPWNPTQDDEDARAVSSAPRFSSLIMDRCQVIPACARCIAGFHSAAAVVSGTDRNIVSPSSRAAGLQPSDLPKRVKRCRNQAWRSAATSHRQRAELIE
jgi:hypothetical protein